MNFEKGFVRNQEVQWYQSENAFQQGGNLIFEGKKEDPFNTRLNPNYKKKSKENLKTTLRNITPRNKKGVIFITPF